MGISNKAVDAGDMNKAKKLYFKARKIYLKLEYEEKKKVYKLLMDVYDKLNK